MSDHGPMDDTDPTSLQNILNGRADQVVQSGEIHGGVHVWSGAGPRWLALVAVLAVAGLVSVVIIAWPRASPTAASPAPADLRVSADLSYNDQPPWGYVSASPTFPGPTLITKVENTNISMDDSVAAALRHTDAAKLKTQTIRLHLEGPRDHPVRITDIKPVVVSRKPPLSGSLVWAKPQGGEESTEAAVYLDDQFPILQATKPVADGFVPAGPLFPAKTINLNPGETSEVVVTALADKGSYEYKFAVVYESGDTLSTQVVDNNGQPFRVSGLNCGPTRLASYGAAYLYEGKLGLTPADDPQHLAGMC
ncbi:hypothetical protein [Kutzneria sp. 744]|uniref:hypothetical protein n=1 Tax=Kutzneria sp. (strain 744) TaxID=345341 RepID=UPI0003EED3AE|nr:hypothetical protein [Kutzneria sp. 744]EWM19766.1 hypothetical protein KUTG_10070 [Kutzneria sp. 744]